MRNFPGPHQPEIVQGNFPNRAGNSPLRQAIPLDHKYFGYPVENIKNGGHFKGTMLEGVVTFGGQRPAVLSCLACWSPPCV
jgi:hypothetical protein